MTLPKKVYEGLKFVVQLVPVLVTFIGATFIACGVNETAVNIILIILGAIGTAMTGVVQICRSNHWKIIAEDGSYEDAADDTTPLPPYPAAEGVNGEVEVE